MVFWKLNPEVLGLLWLMTSVSWWGESLWLTPPRLGKADHTSYELYLGICLTTEEITENLSQSSRIVRDCSLHWLGCLSRDSLGWPAEHLFPLFTMGDFSQPQVAQVPFELLIKGIPTSANYESTFVRCSDVVSEKWNPHILMNLPATNVPRCVSCSAKTIGL
jgi:hypothetical protein